MNTPDKAVEQSYCNKCDFLGVPVDGYGAHNTPLGDRCHYAASKPIATAAGTAFPAATPATPPPSAWSDEAGAVVERLRKLADYLWAHSMLPVEANLTRQAAALLTTAREGWPADRARADAAEAREKALREALEPFAREYIKSGADHLPADMLWQDANPAGCDREADVTGSLTVGDFRRARATHEGR